MKAMEKYKEAVMKLITTEPQLAPTQMTILEDRLTHIFSQFRTPNHPPYAAMIQRALQELNQKGGSSEDSISQFIKREYDDLPWAHFTLLKHHLGLLCKSGELVVTHGPRYSLAVAGSGLGSMKCGRKHPKRKRRWRRRWDWERRQSKRHKTEYEKLQTEDEIAVIEERRQIDDQHNQVPGNEISKGANGQIEGIQQLKQESLVGAELLQSSVGIENGISSDSRVQTNESPMLTRGYKYQAEVGVQQEEECEPRKAEMIDFCDPHAQQQQERKPNEDVMLEPFSPERPPGFESMRVEKSSNCQDYSSHDFHPEKIPNLLVATKTDLLAASNNSERHSLPQGHVEALLTSKVVVTHLQQKIQLFDGCDQLKQHETQPADAIPIVVRAEPLELEQVLMIKKKYSLEALGTEQILEDQHLKIMAPHGPPSVNQNMHALQPAMTSTTVSINMQQIEPGEHLASSNLGDSREICGRKRQMQLESTSETGSPLSENHKQEQHRDAEEPSNAETIEINELSCTLQQIKEKQQQEKNRQHQGEKHFEQKLMQRTVVLALPHQQKGHQLLDAERIKDKPPLLANSVKYQQRQNKQYFRKKRMRCQKKEMTTKDVTVDMDQTTPEHLMELSNIKESQMLKLTMVDSLSKEQEESRVRQKGPELQSVPSKTKKDLKQLNQEFEPGLSDPERVSGLESLGSEESSQTERMRRQLRRWSGKLPKTKPTIELLPSSELCENYTPVEILSSDVEKPQEQKKRPSELTQITEQRAKLRSWQKQNGAQLQATTVSLCSPMDLQQKLSDNHACVKRCPEPELGEDLQPQLQQKLLGQEKPSHRVLRPRPPKPESVSSADLDKLPPSDHECKRQHQTDYEGQGRPLKAKPDAIMKNLAVSDIQSEERQRSVNQGRGRHLNSKPGATMDKLLASNSQFEGLQHTVYQGRGRTPKAKSDTKFLRESTSSIHQNQQDMNRPPRYELAKAVHTAELLILPHQHEDQQQRKYRRKGRPPKAKLDMVVVRESTPPDFQNQQAQKQAERRGHCMPPEENSEATKIEEALLLSSAMHNSQQEQQLEKSKD